MGDVTRILADIEQGDPRAAEQLLPLVYDELRKLAAAKMAAEKPDHTLDATALVHEAFLRLVGDQHFDGRGHFFAAAAEAMRRIFVDNARRKQSKKRGGDRVLLNLNQLAAATSERLDDVLDIALTALFSDLRGPIILHAPVGDGVDHNDIGYNKTFPYEGTPQNGRTHTHP
jgi:RNA polymerase sigma factor (TIGR02999 family)